MYPALYYPFFALRISKFLVNVSVSLRWQHVTAVIHPLSILQFVFSDKVVWLYTIAKIDCPPVNDRMYLPDKRAGAAVAEEFFAYRRITR